jgi:hypothetical protein
VDLDRRELERLAYAKPTTDVEAAAAADALRRLVADDAAHRAELEAIEPEAAPEPAESRVTLTDPPEVAPTRRRTLLPLIVAVGLLVGLGVGILVARGPTNLFGSAATPSATPSTHAPILGGTTNALAELARPRTSADVFPVPNFATELNLEDSSIHRILTTGDGITLWVARTPDAICMMFTGHDIGLESDAGSTCASLFEFSDTGLTLTFGRDKWVWDGSSFTTTIEY